MELTNIDEGFVSKVTASSYHQNYPTENIISKSLSEPWISTGLFPQFATISFHQPVSIDSIEVTSYNVRDVLVEVAQSNAYDSSSQFEELSRKTLPYNRGQLQSENLLLGGDSSIVAAAACSRLKITVESGYDAFFAIYKLAVSGSDGSRKPSLAKAASSPRLRTTRKVKKGVLAATGESEPAFSFGSNVVQTPDVSPTDGFGFSASKDGNEQHHGAEEEREEEEEALEQFHSTFRLPVAKREIESHNTTQVMGKTEGDGISHWTPNLPEGDANDSSSMFPANDPALEDDDRERDGDDDNELYGLGGDRFALP